MKAIDSHKIGLIAIAALTLSACENTLTSPDAQDVDGIDAYQSIPAPIASPPLLPPPPPPVLIFENGNETLCVPQGRSHQLQWLVFDITGHVNVNLSSREPGAATTTSEYTTTRTNTNVRAGEGGGNFSSVMMDPEREYRYTVSPVHQYIKRLVYSRSGWFRVSYSASGGQLICY